MLSGGIPFAAYIISGVVTVVIILVVIVLTTYYAKRAIRTKLDEAKMNGDDDDEVRPSSCVENLKKDY